LVVLKAGQSDSKCTVWACIVLELERAELLVDNLPNDFVRGHLVVRILLIGFEVCLESRKSGEK